MPWLALLSIPVDALLLWFIGHSIRRTRRYRGSTTVADFVATWQLLMKSEGRRWFFVHLGILGGLVALISFGSLYRFRHQGAGGATEVLAVVSYVLFLLLLLTMRLNWELRPPAILFLASSSDRTLLLQGRIAHAVNPLQLISYLDYHRRSRAILDAVSGIVVLRTSETAVWKSTLEQAMRLAPTIVLDCRTITPALIDEVALLHHLEILESVIFVGALADRDRLLAQAPDGLDCRILGTRPSYGEDALIDFLEGTCRSPQCRAAA